MKKLKIFIACDTNDPSKLNKIKNSQTREIKVAYKIGLEFFLSPKGRYYLTKLKKKRYFLI